ncbi:MAG: serine--tRNA ligase, partial [Clostridia bacterium]|nr:serine--tRNA ligase [Clostridia bacterium]
MLDIKLLRAQPEMVVEQLKRRNFELDLTEFTKLDAERRAALVEAEQLKNQQNTVSKQIPALKKEGKDVA